MGPILCIHRCRNVGIDKCPLTTELRGQRPAFFHRCNVDFTHSNVTDSHCTYCSGFYLGDCAASVKYILISGTSSNCVSIELENTTGSLTHITLTNITQSDWNLSVIYYLNSTVSFEYFTLTDYNINELAYLFNYSLKSDTPSGGVSLNITQLFLHSPTWAI